MSEYIRVGYWASAEEPELPDPRDLVSLSWDVDTRWLVARYLKSGEKLTAYYGWSTCRFCGKPNGSVDLCDGVYVWPEGFAHYVEAHGVKPEGVFLTHVLKRVYP